MYLLQKGLIEKYLCWFVHREPYVPYKTMIEKMARPTSSSSNVHEVIDDNSNSYRNMIIDAMRINHGYTSEYFIKNKEPNANVGMFFDLLKDFIEPL